MHGPVIQHKSIRVLTLMAAISGTLCTAATAQPWNQPIPKTAVESTAQTIKLAEQLHKVGPRFFGAHSCPPCIEKMKLFGKQAGGNLITWNEVCPTRTPASSGSAGMKIFGPSTPRYGSDQRSSRVFNRSIPWSAEVV